MQGIDSFQNKRKSTNPSQQYKIVYNDFELVKKVNPNSFLPDISQGRNLENSSSHVRYDPGGKRPKLRSFKG